MSSRPPGRPPIDRNDRTVSLTVRVPSKTYDRMVAEAQRDRVSVAEWLRRKAKPERSG